MKSILGWTFIKQPSWSRSWIRPAKLVMESILETEAATILQFFAGLRGTLSVTFEEGTWSAWLYDLLHSRVDDPAGGRFEDHILYRPAHYDVECSRMLLPLLRNFNIDAFGLQS